MAESDEKDQYKQAFIERVRSVRISSNKKQWQIAHLMGIQQDEYKHYEVGRLLPHHLIGRFCLITNVNPIWLLTGEGPKVLQPLQLVEPLEAPAPRKKRAKRSKAA